MSTVLFAHDGYISLTNEGIYSDTYDNKIIERYLNIAENVVFMVRTCDYLDNDKNLNKITIENFSVKGIKNFKSLRGIFGYRAVTQKVKYEVQRADYIVARIPSDLGFLVAKYAKKYNKRYILEVVGCPWDSLRNHSLIGKLIAPYYYLRQKRTIKHAPNAIYVTNEFLQRRYPCKGKSIGCSDVEIKGTDEAVMAIRNEKINKTDMHSLVFGTLGSLHMKYKGYDTAIKALAKLNGEGYSHKYLIVGSGDSSWLKSVIHKYHAEQFVTIIPSMPHEKVFKWIDNIDIYIQPSKTEGMPRALIEAMSRACPCIGSKVGGIIELISEEYIFQKSNINDLYRVIKLYNTRTMAKQAQINYEKSKSFDKQSLENKRVMIIKAVVKGTNFDEEEK